MAKQLALYEEFGLETQKRHLGEPLAFLVPVTGNINSFMHIWAYENAADREAKRAAMKNDPGWQYYVKLTAEAGYYVNQENKLMNDAVFYLNDG